MFVVVQLMVFHSMVGINSGLGGRDPQILGREVVGVAGGRGRVVKCYYTLSCTGSMFESGDV